MIFFQINFSYYYQYILIAQDVQKNTQVGLMLFILQYMFRISWRPHVNHILPKLPAPHKRLIMPGLVPVQK
jgi:hypothetical protein